MSRDVRAPLLAAFASVMTLLVLSPLLVDRSWLQPVVLVVVAVGLTGAGVAAAGLPRWSSPVLTSLVALVITTALLVPSQAALAGFLPTPSSVRALGVLLRLGIDTSNAVQAPAPVEAGVVALLSVAAGVLVVLVVLVAGPLRRPGAAGLPLLLVVCVATALAPAGIGLQGFLLAAVGYLALALTDADQRVRAWGQVLTRSTREGTPIGSGVAESFVRPAAVAALGALVIGAAVPLLVPGVSGQRLQAIVDREFGEGGRAGITTINPFPDIRRNLESRSEQPVLTYETADNSPDPLRILTADEFDGAVWRPSQVALSSESTVDSGLPTPPGASAELLDQAEQVVTTISIDGLDQSYLPLPYPPSSIEVAGTWLYDAATLNVIATDDVSTVGLRYAVSSYDIAPLSAQLLDAPPQQLDDRWTAVPDDLREVVLPAAQEVVAIAGATTRYEQAVALQQWFRSGGGFAYSLDAPNSSDRDAVAAFLEQRRGYCVQFASTMTLMARSLDIPARVAVGFLPGEQVDDGVWEIRAADAHAWPELYFEGTGWVRFEPTPGTRTGALPSWAVPPSDTEVPVPGAEVPTAAPTPQPLPEDADTSAEGSDTSGVATLPQVLRGLGTVLLVLVTLGLLGSLPRAWRWFRHRRRLARAGDDAASLALVAWAELLERLADLGVVPRGGTVREQAADFSEAQRLGETERQALARLAESSERAVYAVEPAPADDLQGDARTVLSAVRHRTDRTGRLRAVWLPTPFPRPRDSAAARTVREPTSV